MERRLSAPIATSSPGARANEASQRRNSTVTNLRIFAHGMAKPGQAAALRALVVDLLKNSRGESGLEIYEAFESLDGQEFIFSEQYAGQEALNRHMNTARFKEIMALIYPIIDGEIRIWTVNQIT